MAPTEWITHHGGIRRCWWCGEEPIYLAYHDTEWGVPTADDRYLFEKICLEGFQAGLSWLTVLRKREHFRQAFHGFDMRRVARMGTRDVERLVQDPRIIRHRGKIESAINNATLALDVCERFGSLAAFLWRFAPDDFGTSSAGLTTGREIPAVSAESKALSRELRRQGFSFVGPTTMYALMQSVGMVNDHLLSCHRFEKVEKLRKRFARPV